MKRRDIRIRDPYIVLEDGVCYLYATSGERTLSCYRSVDLENWAEDGIAMKIVEELPI